MDGGRWWIAQFAKRPNNEKDLLVIQRKDMAVCQLYLDVLLDFSQLGLF